MQNSQGCRHHVVDQSTTALGGTGDSPTPLEALHSLQVTFSGKGVEVCASAPSSVLRVEGASPVPPKSGLEASRLNVQLNPPADSSVILNDTANLDGFESLPLYQEPVPCEKRYIVLQCNCRRTVVPSVCMRLDCPNCAPWVGKRRSSALFRRLLNPTPGQRLKSNKKTIIYTVFTVPVEKRERYFDPKKWSKVRKQIWKHLKEKFGALYGVEVSHPVGDKNKSVFHPHLNFLWCQRQGFRPYLEVEELRELWKEVLGAKNADVYTRYSDQVRKIKHWCNYVARTFPGMHKWTGSARWYGKYPVIKTDFMTVCCDCGHAYNMIGFINKNIVDDYYHRGFLLGLDPPWENDDNIMFAKNKKMITA